MTETVKFDPGRAARKALLDSLINALGVGATAAVATFAQPEVTASVLSSVSTLIPAPWNGLALLLLPPLIQFGGRFIKDWRKHRTRVLGSDEVARARERYERSA